MANFSLGKNDLHSGAVMVTVLIAMRTILPLHSRWTFRHWVMVAMSQERVFETREIRRPLELQHR